jgi:hypothetical protein
MGREGFAAAMSAGADVKDADRNGCTRVWLAARYGHAQSLAALLSASLRLRALLVQKYAY